MVQPITRAWNLAKKLDDNEKLELVSIIIDSLKPAVAPQALRRYTMEEINAMIDQSERDIVEGRVYDFDEAMDELEKEFARRAISSKAVPTSVQLSLCLRNAE